MNKIRQQHLLGRWLRARRERALNADDFDPWEVFGWAGIVCAYFVALNCAIDVISLWTRGEP